MDNKECDVCKKLTKEKYKYYKVWQCLAIIFICLTVVFAILYFVNTDVVKTTVVEYENEVTINNGGSNNTNNENGTIKIDENTDNTGLIIVVVVCTILVGGAIVGCYFISQKNNKDKE